ncbi:sigma factor-like helix-turn-helix DNA-binding protein [Actinoplanes sp. N902-109]|uniref:sigma factor-like helix-turn-helix DNA-binding protein n=1 Tax=Actinoplanes sp. (strain N902-109) TaxID=649831 RepID=UPI0003296464|nr:sigma factor-like helix-turn-helix DNA-binding protein [Actinoplanes sp. N902-109]AGL15275.1 ECF subfamily RNA polymerase sigma-24 subunit [Actinoplanes sp. N902-109]
MTDDYVAQRYVHLRRAAFLMCGDWTRAGAAARATLARALTEADVGDLDLWAYADLMAAFKPEHGRREHVFVAPGEAGAADTGAALSDVWTVLVLDALRRLPPKCRAVLVLHHFCHLSVVDTADVLGLDAGKVTEYEADGLAAFAGLLAATQPAGAR